MGSGEVSGNSSSTRARPWAMVESSPRCSTSGRNRPSKPSTGLIDRSSSRCQITSVVSPKVQIIAMPVPLAGSASRCESTGTGWPNTGVIAVVPNSSW